jgi:hypothetical protein
MLCSDCGSTASETGPCATCGQDPLLDGDFALEALLGEGHGRTFRARRVADDQAVVVKVLPLPWRDDPKAVALAEREVAVLQQLSHPGIPAYLDHRMVGAGRNRKLVLIQEFVPGQTLDAELRTHRYTEAEVLDMMGELAGILGYLHSLSPPVIHRDVKPANVMRRPDGTLALLDFGAVRDHLVDADLGGSTVAGTFGYMAPEQFAGDATARSDLYGLGATAVALLGRRPPKELLNRSGQLVWREAASASAGTAALLDRLLSPDPDLRPESALVVREALSTALVAPAPSPPPTLPVRHEPRSRGNVASILIGLTLVAGLALLLLSLVLGGGAVMLSRDAPAPAPPRVAPPADVPARDHAPAVAPEGATGDARIYGYDLLGVSSDGGRLAVLYTNPLAEDSWSDLVVYEAGAAAPTEEWNAGPDWWSADRWQTADLLLHMYEDRLSDLGISLAEHPTALDWKLDGSVLQVEGHAPLRWETFMADDPDGTCQIQQWRVCSEDGEHCILPTTSHVSRCQTAEPQLVALYEQGDHLWVVAERPRDRRTTPRLVAGGPWPDAG